MHNTKTVPTCKLKYFQVLKASLNHLLRADTLLKSVEEQFCQALSDASPPTPEPLPDGALCAFSPKPRDQDFPRCSVTSLLPNSRWRRPHLGKLRPLWNSSVAKQSKWKTSEHQVKTKISRWQLTTLCIWQTVSLKSKQSKISTWTKNFHDPYSEGNKKMSLEKAGGHADLIWLCQSC